METTLIFNPGISSRNLGDQIIAECAFIELHSLIENSFVREFPTHLPVVHSYQVWRQSIAVNKQINANRKFVIGSNLLVKNMLTHYPQWNVNIFNYKIQQGCILVGVGAGAGDDTNKYTVKLYQKMLNHEYYHSVRDERSKEYVELLGLKALNTGCVTMWKLTPEFCRQIPTQKSKKVVFTLTGVESGIDKNDQKLIDILNDKYEDVYFWVQGDIDLEYLNKFERIEKINIVPPTLEAYDRLLNEHELDYIGTRLHGGVYAMRHKKRAIIIAIDERAREINRANNLNCIEKSEIPTKLESFVDSEFKTEIKMPLDVIQKWKNQFEK